MISFNKAFEVCPLIAILRGVRPEEVMDIGQVLVDIGFTIIEVPLNSPSPYQSIELLQERFGSKVLIGAGTVTSVEQVDEVKRHGGRLIVMPHADPTVIAAAKAHRLYCTPGVATPTEGFTALKAGADALKMFPAEQLGIGALSAWKSIFPPEVRFIPVGGITPDNMPGYLKTGAAGFGLGSALYHAGKSPEDVALAAGRFIQVLS